MDYQPGDIVDITIRGARVVDIYRPDDGKGENLRFTYTARDGEQWPCAVWAQAPSVVIKQADPFGWPPRHKDVWRDRNGTLYLVVETHRGDLLMNGTDCGRHGIDYVARAHGPLTLVHREERDGGPSDG